MKNTNTENSRDQRADTSAVGFRVDQPTPLPSNYIVLGKVRRSTKEELEHYEDQLDWGWGN